MAEFKIEEKDVMAPSKKKIYTLELDEKEFKVLVAILWRVGGSPVHSFRKYIQPLIKLTEPDNKPWGSEWYENIKRYLGGSLIFNDFDSEEPNICDSKD